MQFLAVALLTVSLINKYQNYFCFTNFFYLIFFNIIYFFIFIKVIYFYNVVFSFFHVLAALFLYKNYFIIFKKIKKNNFKKLSSLIILFFGSIWAFNLYNVFFLWDFIEVIALLSVLVILINNHIQLNKIFLLALAYSFVLKTFHSNALVNNSLHKFVKNLFNSSALSLYLCFIKHVIFTVYFYNLKIFYTKALPRFNIKNNTTIFKNHYVILLLVV